MSFQFKKVEIVFCTLPYTETSLPLMAPAVLKSIASKAGKSSVTLDLNQNAVEYIKNSKNRYDLLNFFHDGVINNSDIANEIYELHLKFANIILLYNPEIVGLSVFTYNCQVSTKLLCTILKKIKPDLKIIIGGAGISNNLLGKSKFGDSLVQNKLIDFYIKGDGEHSLYEYLTTNSRSLVGINTEHWKELSNDDLVKLPVPDYSDYDFESYDYKEYKNRVVPILGSRGCVRNCSFCDVHNHWKKFTWRSGEHIFEEMLELNRKYKATYFMFQDSLINGNQKEYKKMCSLISEYNSNKPISEKFYWGGFFIFRPKNQFKEEDWKFTAQSGASYLAIGVETFNDESRFHLGKKFTNDDIEFGLQMAKKYNIHVNLLFFTGYIKDTEEDIIFAENWLRTHVEYQDILSLNLGTPLGILPGSPLYNNFDELGLQWIGDSPEDWYNPANDNHPLTRSLWNQRLIKLAKELNYRMYGGADNRYILERMLRTYDANQNFEVVTSNN